MAETKTANKNGGTKAANQAEPIETIVSKLTSLNGLDNKRMRLATSRAKLHHFAHSAEDNLSVTISDRNQSWSTSNSDVVSALIKVVSDAVENSLIETEAKMRSLIG